MYILPPVHELTIVGVFEAGVPNRERIILRPTEPINLASFALVLTMTGQDGLVIPLPDHFFWLGERWLVPPAWIVVFTGPGRYQEGIHGSSGVPVIELHWGKSSVLFGPPGIAVSLIRISAIASTILPPAQIAAQPAASTLPSATNPHR